MTSDDLANAEAEIDVWEPMGEHPCLPSMPTLNEMSALRKALTQAASTEQAGAVGHPIDWDNIRSDLAHLRSVLLDALVWLDEIDPTPTGLAVVADITELDAKRKGRPS